MKKIVASVGLVALGAAGLQAADQTALTGEPSKPWSVAATLRGFYDDNINSLPDGVSVPHRDSFGFEVSPSAVVSWPLEQTSISLAYVYAFKYYDHRPIGNSENFDQTHTFNASLDHAFSERYQASVRDSFVIGQEPDLLRAGNSFATFTRVPGYNIRNYGSINFDGQLTRLLGYEIGYNNAFYDYANTGGVIGAPSLAGLLNRLEHTAHLDSRWQLQPDTVGIFGYQFREIDYTGNEPVGADAAGNAILSDIRNSRTHYGYLGLDHTFRPDLTGSVRVGASYTEYYNAPSEDSQVSPYALANLRWTYMPESFVEVGITHDRSATDITQYLGVTDAGFTADQETTVIYATVNQRLDFLSPKLYGSLMGQFQDSAFNGGLANNKTEQFYMAGVNLEYRFNHFWSAQVGYNYDNLQSELGRTFDRNRVYLGISARY